MTVISQIGADQGHDLSNTLFLALAALAIAPLSGTGAASKPADALDALLRPRRS